MPVDRRAREIPNRYRHDQEDPHARKPRHIGVLAIPILLIFHRSLHKEQE